MDLNWATVGPDPSAKRNRSARTRPTSGRQERATQSSRRPGIDMRVMFAGHRDARVGQWRKSLELPAHTRQRARPVPHRGVASVPVGSPVDDLGRAGPSGELRARQARARECPHADSGRGRAPHVYAQMLDASYAALKRVSTRNLVIGGDTYTWGNIPVRLWIENLRLPNGRPPRMDLYGHNPFSYRAPNLANPSLSVWRIRLLRSGPPVTAREPQPRYPGHPIKLFLSEWTIPTSPRDSEFNFYVSLRRAGPVDPRRLADRPQFLVHLRARLDPPSGRSAGDGSSGGLLDDHGAPQARVLRVQGRLTLGYLPRING